MLALALCLQVSLFGSRLELGERPPEVRAARHLLLLHREVENVAPEVTRTREEALAQAAALAERARSGEDFAALARELSEAPTSMTGGVLGTFAPRVLDAPLDDFLFGSDIDEVSGPLDARSGVHLLQRIEAHAGVRQVFVAGTDDAARERAQAIADELRAGADLATIARERSDDPTSRSRDGQYAVFERGAADTLLKEAVFEAEMGAIAGPIGTPLGWHVVRRVPPEEIDRDLWETRFVRLRALVLAHEESQGLAPVPGRTREAALALATDLRSQIAAGADMASIARRLDDDPGGREREGDLGWLHRGTPGLPAWISRAWLERAGWLSDVISTPAGFVLLRREA